MSEGNVLLPVDTAGRAFELILILEEVSKQASIFSMDFV